MKQLQDLETLKNNPYCWPGGYAHIAIMADGECLCHDCVLSNYAIIVESTKDQAKDGWQFEGIDVNWESENIYCAHCNKRILSEYGEDN